eukprot:TRINITY_DN29728_c0_g1_i1.p1 TRINITY_DN29728_c0_g1~~TRINITY_DN29728_c0_g1_i1.p1  ORF type:complete len:105 (-),score=2.58 TRINITY_DN29728_c0_g1_i1:42-356(-)
MVESMILALRWLFETSNVWVFQSGTCEMAFAWGRVLVFRLGKSSHMHAGRKESALAVDTSSYKNNVRGNHAFDEAAGHLHGNIAALYPPLTSTDLIPVPPSHDF